MNQTQLLQNITLGNDTKSRPFDLGGIEFSPLERTLLISVVCVLITMSVIPNLFVIFAVNKHKPLMAIPNYFLVSLSCTDILTATVVMPIALQYNLEGVWRHGVFACKAWAFTSYFCCASSIFHLCAIAIDRYRAITDPLEYGSKRTWCHLLKSLALVWTLSFVGTFPPYLGWGITWPDHYDDSIPCTVPQSRIYATYSSMTCFYIPMIVLVVIYIKIFLIGRNRSRQKIRRAFELFEINQNSSTKRIDTSQAGEAEPDNPNPKSKADETDLDNPTSTSPVITVCSKVESNNLTMPKLIRTAKEKSKSNVVGELCVPCSRCAGMTPKSRGKICQPCASPNNLVTAAENSRLTILLRRERRSAFIMSIIIITFIICWMPAFTIYFVLALLPEYQKYINPKVIMMVWWMTYSNSACNPIIYTMFNKDFKDAFNKFVRRS